MIMKFESPIDIIKTFECGQCFRWENIGKIYRGIIMDYVVDVRQIDSHTIKIINRCNKPSDNQFENIIYEYFNPDQLRPELPNDANEFEKDSYKFGEGIIILEQDLWESLVSFIISQQNNIPRIRSLIDKLCTSYGNVIATINGRKYYSFPRPEELKSKCTEKGIIGMGFGYRAKYILSAIDMFLSGTLSELLFDCPLDHVLDRLKEYDGVGDKVANCVALYSLKRYDVFPIDVWMKKIIDKYFDGNFNPERYKGLQGIMQQYMFYTERSNK